MNELTNVFESAKTLYAIVGIGIFVLILLMVVVMIMLNGLLKQIKYCYTTISDHRTAIDNLTQASKRTERMCDAINQRTRSYSTQLRQKTVTKTGKKPNHNPKINKGPRKYENKKVNDTRRTPAESNNK